MSSSKLFSGSLETIILSLMENSGEMYGYEITQKIKILTEGKMAVTEGALYPALHRLKAKGWVESNVRSIGNRQRKYYSVTSNGKKATIDLLQEMQDFVKSIALLMQPKLT